MVRWRVEVEEAARVLCPLRGKRFQYVQAHHLYQPQHFYVRDFEFGWEGWSPQFQKAMQASLDWTRWPADELEPPWPQPEEDLNSSRWDESENWWNGNRSFPSTCRSKIDNSDSRHAESTLNRAPLRLCHLPFSAA